MWKKSTGVGTADVMRGVNDLKYFLKYFLDCGICCTILSSLPLQHYINSVGGVKLNKLHVTKLCNFSTR